MQHKWMVLFATLILFSLVIAPVGTVQARADLKSASPHCPPYSPTLLRDKAYVRSLPQECMQLYRESFHKTASETGAENLLPTLSGGPDGFGYSYNDTAPYSWISASIDSGLTGDDQFSGPINIGFNFPFYGVSQSQLYFSTNGLITFGAGSSDYYGTSLPFEFTPNNLIAPFWDDLLVGSPYNSGVIYYARGGTAPNRYFAVEWRNVEALNACSYPIFTFEAILYESGDIVLQYQSLPDCHYASVGLEDSLGSQGLEYSNALSAPKAIRFSYPATATARLLVFPVARDGGFAPLSGYKDFSLTVTNPGSLGADTYDLTSSSSWPVAFYASNGSTPLVDTDSDGLVDTGSLAQGTSISVIARVSTPGGAQVGDSNTAAITIASSLNVSRTKTVSLFTSIPVNFTSVFLDRANSAISFMATDLNGASSSKFTPDHYPAYDVAMTKLEGNNYLYIWTKDYFNGSDWQDDIEYAMLTRTGTVLLPVTKLVDNSNASMNVSDRFPAVTMAPNGTIGIAWSRYLYDSSIDKYNYNVYFARLDKSGNLLSAPINITNNLLWSANSDLNVPRFHNITIAASSDNRFVIGWGDDRYIGNAYSFNLGYAIRDTNGTNIVAPLSLTQDNASFNPVLNSLTGGKVILTWQTSNSGFRYQVINSNGTTGAGGVLSMNVSGISDAVQLPNGKVAVAWPTSTGVGFAILSSSYAIEQNVTANTPNSAFGDALSVTTDASSHVIMTWASDGNLGGFAYNNLFYALGDSAGTFLTPPILYKTSTNFIDNNYNGQGNAACDNLITISGNAGIGGAVLRYTDGILQTVTADGSGAYSLQVPVGWSGTVTPHKQGYQFTPLNKSYNNIQGNQTAQDYTAQVHATPGDTTGVFRPSNGLLYLKNKNMSGYADIGINYGMGGDYPVVGDWDGDGIATIGIYRNGKFYLRNSNTIGYADVVFAFGSPGDQPVAGDWNGDGIDTIGVYRSSTITFYLRNENSAGAPQMSFQLGMPGDVGIAGDWNGDGKDTTGVFRPSNGVIFLKNQNNTGYADIGLNYGIPGDKPVTGDWDNNGTDTIGIYRNGVFYLRNSNTIGYADILFFLGIPGDMPIAGDWDGLP